MERIWVKFLTERDRQVFAAAGYGAPQASHAVSLCDMHAKYADVRPSADALAFLEGFPADQFNRKREANAH